MNRFTTFFSALLVGMSLVLAAPVACNAASSVNKQQVMDSWRDARAKFQAEANAAKVNAAKAKLVKALEASLNDTEGALGDTLDALDSGDQNQIAKAAAALKAKLKTVAANQAKLKGDKQLAGASGNLVNMLGDVLAQQNQANRSTVKNIR